tara:strand:+ start:288 stop:1331 length:1044 start_codon:yes stop_codon:yes gene_type:complete
MAPIKSSLARSVGKLLGVYKDTDLSLRGDVQSNRFKLPPFEASGGNIDATAPGDGYKYHLFSADGTFVMPRSHDIEVLLIGGGGAGAAYGPPNGAGGGGAGGVVHHSQLTASGTLTINVGDGAADQADSTKANGSDSSIVSPAGPWTITALGGGAGGYFGVAGNDGGSGGGGGGYGGNYSNNHAQSTQAPQNAPFVPQTGFNQYGNNGGAPSDNNPGNAGGGGGAGSVGGSHPEPEGAPPGACGGGDGRAFPSFPGALPGFAPMPSTWKTTVGPTGLFAGGGAGESPYGTATPSAVAGPGGGGGYYPGPDTFTKDAVANTGSGGAGTNTANSGAGGKGICIIRYQPG